MTSPLRLTLLLALWLGLNGVVVFFLQLCLGIFSPWPTVILSFVILGALLYKNPIKFSVRNYAPELFLLVAIAFFILMANVHYPLGGWDAWSCWNLKAKFIYLGHEHFRNMFDPILWRSNTQYPLLLPCINTWFWDLTGGAHTWGPMVMSITIALLSASTLLFSLLEFTKSRVLSMLLTGVVFLLPFNVTLIAGQYSDILVGLFLLSAFVSLKAQDYKLMGFFVGLLSFTKTEGTVAAVILATVVIFMHRKHIKAFLPGLILMSLPAIIFTLTMAPHNEAFVNGFTSSTKPSDFARLQTIVVYQFAEMISLKWNGIFIILVAGLAFNWKKLGTKKHQDFLIFLGVFLMVLFVYYQINTFFEITWWLGTTLHRILFVLLPTLMFWLGLLLCDSNLKPSTQR